MAAVTHLVSTADTGVTPNTSASFVCAVGDLVVMFAQASATTDAAPATSCDNTDFTLIHALTVEHNGGVSRVYVFVGSALVTDTSGNSVIFDTAADPATGTVLAVYKVTGMPVAGLAAIRQSAKQDNVASGTPAPVFGTAALTGNPILGAVANLTNPAALTPPSGWTETAGADVGYSSPTTGLESCFIDSGFTGTTVTWGGASPSAFGSVIIELAASSGAEITPSAVVMGLTGLGSSLGFGILMPDEP